MNSDRKHNKEEGGEPALAQDRRERSGGGMKRRLLCCCEEGRQASSIHLLDDGCLVRIFSFLTPLPVHWSSQPAAGWPTLQFWRNLGVACFIEKAL
eukprot:c10228_g1_i2 orf=35-322(+)